MKWGEFQESFCGESGLGTPAKALNSSDLSCASGWGGGCSCSRIEGQGVGRLWQCKRTMKMRPPIWVVDTKMRQKPPCPRLPWYDLSQPGLGKEAGLCPEAWLRTQSYILPIHQEGP